MHGYPYNGQQWGWVQDSFHPQQYQFSTYQDPLSNVNPPSVIYPFGTGRLSAKPSHQSSYGTRSIDRRRITRRPPPPKTSSKIPYVLAVVFLLLIVATVVVAVFLSKQEDETVDGWLTLTNVDVQSSQFTDFEQGFCSELELATTVDFKSCEIIKTSVLGELTFRIATGDNEKATEDIEAAVMQQAIFTGQQILHNNVDFSSESIQCSTSSCENGGVCYDTIASFQCECPTGFSGQTCDQDSMQCATSPCLHGGTCSELAVLYSCTCAPSYTGTNCETETGIVVGWINVPTWTFNDNLLNSTSAEFMAKLNEICDDLGTVSPVVSCDMIFESTDGVRANFTLLVPSNSSSFDDILITLDYSVLPNVLSDENRVVIIGAGDAGCANYGCLNQATCVYQRPFGNYSCDCINGYVGVKCESDVDECLVGPCQNNATCQEGIGTFTCTCAVGFTGQLCDVDIDDCVTSPCLNGGTCVDQINNFTCTCPAFTMGSNCETEITCDGFPCQNLGTCMVDSGTGARRCDCHTNYMGDYCEISPLIAYGEANGDRAFTLTQNNALDLTLSLGTLPMFGQASVDLKVRDNGYLVITRPPADDCNTNTATFDFYPIIAPLLQENNPDMGSPKFFFRETVDVDIRAQVTAEVCAFMTFKSQTCDFNATYVVIITFENMEPDEPGATGVNTYQVILATDNTQTYALYIYGIILRTGNTCPTMVGYTGLDSADNDVVDLAAIGGFANLVTSSNYGKQPNYIFYLGEKGALHIYGEAVGATTVQLDSHIDENSDVTAAFESPFTYFGIAYTEVHISSNGYVVFGTKPPPDVPGDGLPPCADITTAGFGPAIAVFSTDLTNVTIVYSQVTDSSQLQDMTTDICTFLGGICTFTATWGFVITWDKARPADNDQGPTVTVQLTLVSDGTSSYGIRAYGDIPFPGSACGGSPDKVMLTGVGYTDGLDGGTSDFVDTLQDPSTILSFFTETNIQVAGRWVMSFNSP